VLEHQRVLEQPRVLLRDVVVPGLEVADVLVVLVVVADVLVVLVVLVVVAAAAAVVLVVVVLVVVVLVVVVAAVVVDDVDDEPPLHLPPMQPPLEDLGVLADSLAPWVKRIYNDVYG